MALGKPSELASAIGSAAKELGFPPHFEFDARGGDDESFWFHDGLHHPRPLRAFETIVPEAIKLGLSQANNRLFCFPLSYGIDQRVLNGHVYFCPLGPKCPAGGEPADRSAHFAERGEIYFTNWDEAYRNWLRKVGDQTQRVRDVAVPFLADRERLSEVTGFGGVGLGYKLMHAFHTLSDALFLAWQYHFEMLSLGYAAFLNFKSTAQRIFPSITDTEIIEMLSGAATVLYRPRDELVRLAELAADLGVADEVLALNSPTPAEILESISSAVWIDDWKRTASEWFDYSSGTGFYFDDGYWNDDWSIPWALLQANVRDGMKNSIARRDVQKIISSRNQLVSRYTKLIDNPVVRGEFSQSHALALKVAPYLEDHNFYIEHRFHSIFWSKMKQIGAAMAGMDVLDERDDIFYFNRYEIEELLFDVAARWANGSLSNVEKYKGISRRRKEYYSSSTRWSPPPALGALPENLEDPLVAVLWGITSAKAREWSETGDRGPGAGFKGIPACGGSARGRARVVRSSHELSRVGRGEILICRTVAPSWAVVFENAAAVVSETGGSLSHAAIVCREFGIPSVVNVTGAMLIPDGALVEVDATLGTIAVLGRG